MKEQSRKLKRFLFSRMVLLGGLIAIQVAILLLFVIKLSQYFAIMYGVFLLISVLVLLYVINTDLNPSYKLAWTIPILMFPLVGGLFYLFLGNSHLGKAACREMEEIRKNTDYLHKADPEILETIKKSDPSAAMQSTYIQRCGYRAYGSTSTTFHPSGESKFEALCLALESAKEYIFLEYFIIEEGVMWGRILEILERKAKEGVDVRVIYDGFGCLLTLPSHYYKSLQQKGIKAVEFNPLIPIVSIIMNNRDHRKIAVIDGHTGFMGGINLADEYINAVVKHGHWKDTAIELHGEGVDALTMMFLSMWQVCTSDEDDYAKFLIKPQDKLQLDNGFIQPYSDSPLDTELVGEMTYMNMINRAEKYLYICTPYLIVDNEIITALILAAKNGVDVRIITPHIADKWYVHLITRAYYRQLIAGGVKIYEYTPGFIHSKTFVCDDKFATVGTINLDYRSLYLHFECGVWMYNTSAVTDIRDDFFKTLDKSQIVLPDDKIFKKGAIGKLVTAVLRVFAPLM